MNTDIPIWKDTITLFPQKCVSRIKYDVKKVGNYCMSANNSLINEPIFEYLSPPNDEAVGDGEVEIGRREWLSLGNDARWNLNKDFEHWEDRSQIDYAKSFYTWLAEGDGSRVKLLHDADIVCNKNIFSWIIERKYNSATGWRVKIVRLPESNALLLYDELYFDPVWVPPNEETKERSIYYGSHFEFIMTGFSWRDSERRRFVNVVNGRLKDLKILVYGKVDATFNTSDLDGSRKDVEFRTRTMRSRHKVYLWQRLKSRYWWSSCFFVGTSTIVVGYYDEDGHVKAVEEMPTEEVNGRSNRQWNEKECLSFLYQLLSKIKEVSKSVLDDSQKVLVCRSTRNERSGGFGLSFEAFGSDSSHYSAPWKVITEIH